MPQAPQSSFDRFLRPILASRFLTVSLIIHLLIVVLFGGKVLFSRYVEPPDFQSTGDTTVSTDTPSEPPPPPPEANLPPTSNDASTNAPPPLPAPSLTALATLNPNATSFSVPMPAMAPPSISNQINMQATNEASTSTAVTLPGAMAGRGSGREGTGQKFGEKPAAEQAVLRALRWLQTQQHSDGTWSGGRYEDGFTGLALLCYLGHGDTPLSGTEFSGVVTNAINALITQGTHTNGMFTSARDFNGEYPVYEHAICTYALSEAYAMTKDPRLEPIIRQAVDYIVKGQRDDGGWAYGYDIGPDQPYPKQIKSDTSVSGWQIQALKAAHLTGISGMEAIVHPVLDKAMGNLDRVFNAQDGSYGYRKANDSFNKAGKQDHNLTGVGVLAKLFWLGRVDRDTRLGLKNIESGDLNYAAGNCDLYAWYYDTQACFQAQGSAWEWWNNRFQDILTTQQSSDGSWPPTGGADPGGFSQKPDGDGPIYRTTLCCLMLEVFYRYLPATETGAAAGGEVEGL